MAKNVEYDNEAVQVDLTEIENAITTLQNGKQDSIAVFNKFKEVIAISGNINLTVDDTDKYYSNSTSTDRDVNIPLHSNQAIATKSWFGIGRLSTGKVNIKAPNGVTLNGTNNATIELPQGSYGILIKTADNAWQFFFSQTVNNTCVATGGTITTYEGDTVHTFNASSTFTVTKAGIIRVVLISAGGGGGRASSGVGGAGAGEIIEALIWVNVGSYTITIGAGGTGTSTTSGSLGNDTVAFGLRAKGGGQPSGLPAERSGGSGAGGNSHPSDGLTAQRGKGHIGKDGGNGTSSGNVAGGGGGGMGTTGSHGNNGNGGNAGNGIQITITDDTTWYCQGGGGSGLTTSGTASQSGGSDGITGSGTGTNAAANTGNGGGSRTHSSGSGMNGGSGKVVIRCIAA